MVVVIKRWSERFVHHLACKRLESRELLKITEASTTPITRASLETQHCSGVTAWADAQKLESCFMEWVTDSIDNQKIHWAAGFREKENGIRVWRRMQT